MKIALYSDIHLEYGGPVYRPEVPECDVVVLAGDIGVSDVGVLWAKHAFPSDLPVLYVPGNHEFYGGVYESTLEELKRAAGETPNIMLMDETVVKLGGVYFIGATLWTDFNLHGLQEAWFARRYAKNNMGDFGGLIKLEDGTNLTPEMTVNLHAGDRMFIEMVLGALDQEQFPIEKRVVVTHHTPHPRSIHGRYQRKGYRNLNPAFTSDLSVLMGRMAVWCHGHTHDPFAYIENGTRVVCNPRGGPGTSMRKDYAAKIIELP